MSNNGKILSINISEQKGTTKKPVPEALVDGMGLVNDAHAGPWHRQVSLLDQSTIDTFSREFQQVIEPGAFAENLTVEGIDLSQVAILDRLIIDTINLEVTQIGKSCHGDNCAIFQEVGACVMPKEGIFTRVVSGGNVKPGCAIIHYPRPFKIHLITLSDRAHAQLYTDRSGPRAREILEDFFSDKRWHPEISDTILPDDPDQLCREIEHAEQNGIDTVFTIGSTGVGPRDIAPDMITRLCTKLIPGIMEHIRTKYGAHKPQALLSRSIAGVMNQMQVYTVPGSVKAVNEYLPEILTTIEHTIHMLHGIDSH